MKGTKRETLFRLPNSMTEAILLMRMQGYGGTDWKNTSRHLCTDRRALSIPTVYLTVPCLWPASPHFVNGVESLPSLVLLTSVLCPSSVLQPSHTKFFKPQILSILLFYYSFNNRSEFRLKYPSPCLSNGPQRPIRLCVLSRFSLILLHAISSSFPSPN